MWKSTLSPSLSHTSHDFVFSFEEKNLQEKNERQKKEKKKQKEEENENREEKLLEEKTKIENKKQKPNLSVYKIQEILYSKLKKQKTKN